MIRRRFMQAIVATPAVGALLAQNQTANPATNPTQNPTPNPAATPVPPGRGGGRGRGGTGEPAVTEFATVSAEGSAEIATGYFKPDQMAALRKLSEVMMPPMKGNPGAVECKATEFLDFLMKEGTPVMQTLYKTGLDGLNAAAKKQFTKSFGDVDKAQADAILKPLMVARPWPREWPADPLKHFVAQVHMDIRQATTNSREWALRPTAAGAAGRGGRGGGGFGAGGGNFVLPIDPIYRG